MIELPVAAQKTVLLAGNPNAGKSTLFNLLTGLRQQVGNYPGVTVDIMSGHVALTKDYDCKLIDLPGTYSLYPSSKDERIAVQQLLQPGVQPDLIVYVADVTQLEKQLLLFSQIRDLEIPMVLALNMIDTPGISVKTAILEEHFQVPVVPVSAKNGTGIMALKMQMASALQSVPQKTETYYSPGQREQQLMESIAAIIPNSTAYARLLTLHHHAWLPHLSPEQRNNIAEQVQADKFASTSLQIEETLTRFEYFTPVIRRSLHLEEGRGGMKWTDRLDRLFLHPVLGLIIFFMLMLLVFQAVFAWSSIPMDWIEGGMGNLTEWLRGRFSEGWLMDLMCDGLLAGLTGVLVFIPPIAVLFILIGIMEEVGYMSRVVSLMDTIMRRFGLNGRSIVALVSGGACAIPAIMSTRNISNWRERLITILVTPFISCSARIPVYAILIGFAVPAGTWLGFQWQGLALMGLYLLGIAMALIAAYVLKKIIRNQDRSFLVMELPVYRTPGWRNVSLLVYERTKTFVIEAGKIILVISMVLWFLASFGPGGAEQNAGWIKKNPPLEESFAGRLGRTIEPVIAPLGFDWKIGIAIITSFAAREVFVGTMATIYHIEDDTQTTTIKASMEKDVDNKTGRKIYTSATSWSLLIFYVFAMQCMSTLAIVKRETRSWKWPAIQFVMMTGLAYFGSLLTYQLLNG